MAKVYTTLFPLVITEIEKRVGSVTSIGSRFSVQPGGQGGSLDSRAIAEMITAIMSDLGAIIEARIISGLDVSATTPPSATINITTGTATSHGKKWELSADTTTIIPFDASTYVFFVTIYNNTIEISKTHDSTRCELCRIIVPKPGTTSAIVDDKPSDGYDAYIVSAKDIVYKEDQEFDDASVEKLRDVIGDILADNLIGNIRLSENLKIINTQGTLELDSASVKIKDVNANLLAKFDRNGTFFYDTLNRVVAKFARDEAYLGNILITKNSIQSRDFASGALGSGFQILDNGNAEFNNIFLRGKFSASVFQYDTISAIGGNVLITKNADKLEKDLTSSSTILITAGDVTFDIGDILEMKTDATHIEFFEVTNVTSSSTYTVARDKGSMGPIAWKKGTAIVNYGVSGDGGIFMTASESNAPYFNVFTHIGSPWNSITTRVRLGNLNGFLGYSSDLYGIAVGETNKYLKYDPTNGLQIKGIITAESGSDVDNGLTSGITNRLFTDSTTKTNIEAWKHASDVTLIDGGDIYTGTVTAAKLTVVGIDSNGKLVLSQIGSGTLDNIPDGTSYKLVPSTSITAGQIIVAGLAAAVTGRMFADSATKTNIEAWRHSSDVTLIDGGDIYTNSVTVAKFASEATDRMFDASATSDNIQGWVHASDVTKIDGGDIYTGSVTASKITTTTLSAIVADLGTITAGTVTGATLQTATSGARVLMDTSNLIAYDDAAGEVFKVLITGADVGDVIIGDYANTKGIKWDKSAATFLMKGALTATSGDFTGTVNVGTAGKVYIDGANEVIKVYDASNNLRVMLGKLS